MPVFAAARACLLAAALVISYFNGSAVAVPLSEFNAGTSDQKGQYVAQVVNNLYAGYSKAADTKHIAECIIDLYNTRTASWDANKLMAVITTEIGIANDKGEYNLEVQDIIAGAIEFACAQR